MIDISHIAKLARLGLEEKEKKKLKKEVSAILGFVEKLKEVKADRVEPLAQVTGLENVSRLDKARAKTKQETDRLLKLAPETKDRYVKVKPVL